jgi:hypothetical protein
LGYGSEDQTAHGFRTMASTLLNEQGWHPDLIELQLAHAERNKVRAAYNHAQRLDERRKMMQAYADYLADSRLAALSRRFVVRHNRGPRRSGHIRAICTTTFNSRRGEGEPLLRDPTTASSKQAIYVAR